MRTLLMIKPEIVEKGLFGEIIAHVVRNRFKVVALRMLTFNRQTAEKFYEVHREREFFADLIDYITSGPVVALELDGDGVVQRLRAFIGSTDPAQAAVGTIRYTYGASIQNNAVHASDSPESAKKELAIVFGGS
ncbi:MAG: nucleoside-diphosphate kinase [Candidatus Krumholzibacteria bacterium]|nr:nucleoside-diphosphate kinase [Candidatus Krumholzibacteria bacterium]